MAKQIAFDGKILATENYVDASIPSNKVGTTIPNMKQEFVYKVVTADATSFTIGADAATLLATSKIIHNSLILDGSGLDYDPDDTELAVTEVTVTLSGITAVNPNDNVVTFNLVNGSTAKIDFTYDVANAAMSYQIKSFLPEDLIGSTPFDTSQFIDSVPTQNSNNLVRSGGVYNFLEEVKITPSVVEVLSSAEFDAKTSLNENTVYLIW